MPNITDASVPGSQRVPETEADTEQTIVRLAEAMDGLQAVVEQETELVRAGHLRKATELEPKKAALAGAYVQATERLKANGKLLAHTRPQEMSALGQRHGLLQARLQTNLAVLATAHAVSEGIMRRLSGDLARKAAPQVYGASGRAVAPNPKLAHPLAVSRVL